MVTSLKFGAIKASQSPPYAITSLNGTTIHVFYAKMLRVVSEALNMYPEVIVPEEYAFGHKKSDGNWSGILGQVVRSEVDIGMYPLLFDEDTSKEINYSYPCCLSDTTFMTNKPESVSKSRAIFYPFSDGVWIALAVLLVVMPFLFCIFMNRKVKYQNILFDIFGYLLEQSVRLEVKKGSGSIILTGWIFGAFVITYGYKAVILSFLTIPMTTVIRDIPELGKAAAQRSVTCFAPVGFETQKFIDSDIESWRAIGNCLKRNDVNVTNEIFYGFESRKAFIATRYGLSFDKEDFYISEDSFNFKTYAFPISKNFCCRKSFNRVITKMQAAGLFEKFENEDKFFWLLYTKNFKYNESAPATTSEKISLNDICGAFYILVCGWVLALFTLIGEIFTSKCLVKRKK